MREASLALVVGADDTTGQLICLQKNYYAICAAHVALLAHDTGQQPARVASLYGALGSTIGLDRLRSISFRRIWWVCAALFPVPSLLLKKVKWAYLGRDQVFRYLTISKLNAE